MAKAQFKSQVVVREFALAFKAYTPQPRKGRLEIKTHIKMVELRGSARRYSPGLFIGSAWRGSESHILQ